MSSTHPEIQRITNAIIERSRDSRTAYVERMQRFMQQHPPRQRLSCGNLAHAYAGCNQNDKQQLIASNNSSNASPNLGIITSYNDMLSAHQPYYRYPDLIKKTANALGATAQVAGAVPAMCDGITQGQPGMELSLHSRDVVAMSTTIGLSHNVFDGNLFLGICDKIVPGMLMGALEFGHLPAVFVPAGPMPTGISNKEKAYQRQQFVEKKITREQMLKVESSAYHSPGTCTFYGTANSNQMIVEMLGLQLPGSSFVAPDTALRDDLTKQAVRTLISNTAVNNYQPLYQVVNEKSIINAVVGLLATGGSTNHSIHMVAIARCAGIDLRWDDIHELSQHIPQLTRIYPNGQADVNDFQNAGGMHVVVRELLAAKLIHNDVHRVDGDGFGAFLRRPELSDEDTLCYLPIDEAAIDDSIIATAKSPFAASGGMQLLKGNVGQCIVKTSAVADEHRVVEAPAKVFDSQAGFKQAFDDGELQGDFIAVVRYQGPKANGMPELHQLLPILGGLQDKGQKVALITDGRMSGASGKVPCAIHLTPEAADEGIIAKIEDGDMIRLDTQSSFELTLLVDQQQLEKRNIIPAPTANDLVGVQPFQILRTSINNASDGASFLL